MAHDRNKRKPAGTNRMLSRRQVLQLTAASAVGIVGRSAGEVAQSLKVERPVVSSAAAPRLALRIAQLLNRTRFGDLPPKAIEHAKMIIASTLASAASGSLIDSARIVRELEKERGGKPEATVWFDGAKLPLDEVARVNAMLSDAAASDDSDLRNVAHTGTTLIATGLAIGERGGATGEDLLCAIVTGYEAAGRIGEALGDNRQGFHASVDRKSVV